MLHGIWPAAVQVWMHVLPLHCAVPPVGAAGHVTHVVPQMTCPAVAQLAPHTPLVQVSVPPMGAVGHALQPPQWAVESAKQVPPQRFGAPAGQV